MNLLLDSTNALFVSPVGRREISIKRALARPDFRADPRRLWRMLLANGYRELPGTREHTIAVDASPALPKDPLDRLPLAQARVEGLLLTTAQTPGSGRQSVVSGAR